MIIVGGISLGIRFNFSSIIILFIMMFIIKHMELKLISHNHSLSSVYP